MRKDIYKIRVTKDYLLFSAGHFITYDGDLCERIHGHNYRVAVEIEDDLDENAYVFDFIALRDAVKALTDALDHRMLLPERSSLIKVERDGPNWRASFRDRYWSFPADECVILPVSNTTTEMLAAYLCDGLLNSFAARSIDEPRLIRVEVEECAGQSAEFESRRRE